MKTMAPADAKKILIVDDERSIREILAEALEEFGYAPSPVHDASAALEHLADNPVDVVLSDIEMPGMTGLQLLAEIRDRFPEVDVVMATGVVDTQVAVNAIRRGAADYVTKPFNFDEVDIVLQRTLDLRHLRREDKARKENLEKLVAERTREVQQLLEQLEASYESTLRALVTALDFRDNETQGHSLRVVEYAVVVGKEMGLTEDELVWIRRGAILHDVGKIGIPDAILRKPGKLDRDEWEEMQRHPQMGYDMLRDIPFLKPALDIVLAHQERFDGNGYPNGLKGTEIPLGARIFAVVDTFDAMTSDRPYRAALSIEEACAEIARCAGTQFDPSVSEAFLRVPPETWSQIRARVHREVTPSSALGVTPISESDEQDAADAATS